MARIRPTVTFLFFVNVIIGQICEAQYFGKLIGKLSELHHGVSGEVYAVDSRTLYIKDFTYDGQGPAAYFYAGNTRTPGSSGFRLRDERGSGDVIRKYRKEGVTLTLPEGKTLNNIKIFYVWCEEFAVNFGDVKIPRNFDYPRPLKIDPLQGVHSISSENIVIVDAQTLLIPNLSYDGEAPDAKFWVGQGPKPSPQGVRVPDENGKEIPLRRYDKKTVVLTLPGDLTIFDIGHFGIWCEAFTVDFGHVQIPQNPNVPPSLKMLGVSPQKHPQQQDGQHSRGVSRINGSNNRGNLEATTFRPRGHQHFLANRRSDNHQLFNRGITQIFNDNNNNVIQGYFPSNQQNFQRDYVPFAQIRSLQPQNFQLYNQQFGSQRRIDQNFNPNNVFLTKYVPFVQTERNLHDTQNVHVFQNRFRYHNQNI